MYQEPLDAVPIWLIFVGTCVVTGLAIEAGYRLGQVRHWRSAEEKEASVGAMVGSVLALFAFLLAFTFGMACTHFEARRQVVLNEANAIGTTYLRARLLHEPQRTESLKLLREYVDVRVKGVQPSELKAALARSEAIHELLWAEAVKESAIHPTPITASYISSLNETIDIHQSRVQVSLRNRIPFSIWVGLFLIAILGSASMGYQAGLSATRRSPAMAALVLGFAGVLLLIADIERPQQGFLKINQGAMTSLQASMQAERP